MKHKHYDVIVAWAEGKQIQVYRRDDNWITDLSPSWHFSEEYRIKPMPKPDICTFLTVAHGHTGVQTFCRYGSDNVKFTYDGETHKLKSVEVI